MSWSYLAEQEAASRVWRQSGARQQGFGGGVGLANKGLEAEWGSPTRVLLLGFYRWLHFEGLSLPHLEGRLWLVPVRPARRSTKPVVTVPRVAGPVVAGPGVAGPRVAGPGVALW